MLRDTNKNSSSIQPCKKTHFFCWSLENAFDMCLLCKSFANCYELGIITGMKSVDNEKHLCNKL